MIKNVFFDVGGVIIKQPENVIEQVIHQMRFADEASVMKIWQAHRHQLNKGEMNSQEFLQRLKDQGLTDQPISRLLYKWKTLRDQQVIVDLQMLELVKKLKQKYKVYALTDTFDAHFSGDIEKNIFTDFERVFASHHTHHMKEEGVGFYHHVLKTLQANASECVMIDDRVINIQHARLAGLHAIQYKNIESLKGEFARIGI